MSRAPRATTCTARTRHTGMASRPGAAQNALKSCVPRSAASPSRIARRSSGAGTCHAYRRSSGDATGPVSMAYAYRLPAARRRASKSGGASHASITTSVASGR